MFLFNFRMENIESVVFYTIDKSIKAYRQFAQKQLKEAGFSVTIDQWLVLKNIQEFPQISQQELSRRVFKDTASVTSIIDLLVKSKMITRETSDNDRRRNFLTVTAAGIKTLKDIRPVIIKNRATALNGIDPRELKIMKKNLLTIIDNVGSN